MRFNKYFKKPFKYCNYGQTIFDADENMVMQIRGWGFLGKFEDGEKTQDELGEYITKVLNNTSDNITESDIETSLSV